jgi:pimeloyl-ACP methyl ester carboxylesterase
MAHNFSEQTSSSFNFALCTLHFALASTLGSLALVLLAFGAIAAMIVILVMAISLLRPPRMTDGKAVWVLRRMSPGDLGLRYSDIEFNIRDTQASKTLRIAGWWIPSNEPSDRCVVLLHGYADGKVGSIAWAPLWQHLGYNVLAIDLRAHGYSGGVFCTAGYLERHDVSQAIDQLLARRPNETRQLILFGVSLGAATAAAVAAMRDDIAGVVLESPPAEFRRSAMAQMDRLGAPGRLFQIPAIALAGKIAGCDFDAVRPVDLLKQVKCPIIIVAPDDDVMVSDEERQLIRESLSSRHREDDAYWTVSTGHMLALHAEMEEYERRLRKFLHNA